ncbi:hypothetical protein EDB86DRAFT_3083337 [Lactarius hatsudake]|nr:hypothetical protein EDB86DRAFT_3083337 [Lactarius hatsudake]
MSVPTTVVSIPKNVCGKIIQHNPTIFYDSVAWVASCFACRRNFNYSAADVNASVVVDYSSPCCLEALSLSTRGTVGSTYYTHYSSLSMVEANWGLGSLGRGDTNKALECLLLRCQRNGLRNLNHVPIIAPNTPAVGAGGGPVSAALGLDTSFTAASAPAPVKPTTQGKTLPWLYPPRRVIVF